MPLFSTIAHPSAPTRRRIPRSVPKFVATGLVVGAAILTAVGVVDIDLAGPSARSTQVANPVAHEEFLQLNTTELPPVATRVASVGVPVEISEFLHWNTTAIDNLVPTTANRPAVSNQFFELNTTSLEYPPATYTEPASGPR